MAVEARGSIGEWSSRRLLELDGTLSYDWDLLSRLLTPWTGGRLRLAGGGPRPFVLRGPLVDVGAEGVAAADGPAPPLPADWLIASGGPATGAVPGPPSRAAVPVATSRDASSRAGGDAAGQVYRAMTEYPQMVGGERRDVTAFMRHVPGLMAKDGADGVFAAALPDGRAVALKIADGANRARPPVMVAALARLGLDVAAVAPLVEEHLYGHGHVVGNVRALTL